MVRRATKRQESDRSIIHILESNRHRIERKSMRKRGGITMEK